MLQRPSPSSVGRWFASSRTARRLLVAAVALLVAALLAGLTARLAGGDRPNARATAPSTTAAQPSPAAPSALPPATATVGPPAVAPPPATDDPVTFAKAFAKALWSYDTRRFAQAQYTQGLDAWLTGESQYADPGSIATQVPSAQLWNELRANGQWASATIAEGHIPAAFTTALNADPGALTTAYIYAVTVSGTQDIAWKGGGRGAEARSITVAVQCRPTATCALASISPTVYP